jgi:ankyrin repeat protein
MLLDAGANPGLADRDGVTPLTHAEARGFDAIAAVILAHGG